MSQFQSVNLDLLKALDKLDLVLSQNKLTLEIVICGAFAVQLHGFTRDEQSYDVDSLREIPKDMAKLIADIGAESGLQPKWLNDQASDVAIPDGAFKRATPVGSWKSIRASLVSRQDLISLKVSAFFIRRDVTEKDLGDLKIMKPSAEEIEKATEFVRVTNSPPKGAPKKSFDEFNESVEDVRKLTKR